MYQIKSIKRSFNCFLFKLLLIFIIAKYWKQPKCPPINEWIKKLWYIYTMGCYTVERKKGAPTLWDNMDGSGEHYAK